MAKKKGKGSNRRKSPGGNSFRQFTALVVTVLLIALVFYLLEESRQPKSEKPVEKGTAGERQKMPARPSLQHEKHAGYSAAKAAAPVLPSREKPRAAGPGTVAIIVDDMGRSTREAKSLLAIELPVTFSIIPGFAQAKTVAGIAHERGGEVMVHMPMEPQGYPEIKMEKNGLLVSDSEAQIEAKVKAYLEDVPYAVGANNHMGSRFTEHEEKMRPVLQALKAREMFFIDSKTSPQSTGLTLARKLGIKAGVRQVFLDNVQDVEAIKTQLQQVADTARRRGSAIAICHPHLTTIRALTGMMPLLKKEGITFVYASRLVS